MEEYINQWKLIIEGLKQPHEAVWGKAILECIDQEEYEEDNNTIIILEHDIMRHILPILWNQTFFFHLKQGAKPIWEPMLGRLHNAFIKETNDKGHIWFSNVLEELDFNTVIEPIIKKMVTIAHNRVTNQFMTYKREHLPLYEYDKKNRTILLSKQEKDMLHEYSDLLINLFDYKYAEILQHYNTSPNLVKKVIYSNKSTLTQNSLRKFRNTLLEHFHFSGAKDFFTNEQLDFQELTVMHVLPYWFVFEDALWNIVIVSESTKEEQLNKMPSKQEIEALCNRNQAILKELDYINSTMKKELKHAVEMRLARQYYVNYIETKQRGAV